MKHILHKFYKNSASTLKKLFVLKNIREREILERMAHVTQCIWLVNCGLITSTYKIVGFTYIRTTSKEELYLNLDYYLRDPQAISSFRVG
jgi:hypothetical protein